MKILNYDIEATGLEKPFEAPLQFAAKIYDSASTELSAVNLRGRPPRHTLPSPKALVVTGQRIGSVMNQSIGPYDLAVEIHGFFKKHSPAIVTGYNIISYDEEVLRHTFYANLLQPYVTQFDGNERLDVLPAMQAAAICDPDAYNLPINEKGKQSFKLEYLAPAFGFKNHAAHDALGDVDATMHVANTIRARSPELWRSIDLLRSKSTVNGLLAAGQPVVKLYWNHPGDKAGIKILLPICQDPEIQSKWWCVDLAAETSRVVGVPADALVRQFKSSGGMTPIVGVTTNKMPLIFSLDDPAIAGLPIQFDHMAIQRLRSDRSLPQRIYAANDILKRGYAEKVAVQEQLYSGGFFPIEEDKALFSAFHRSLPAEKYEISSKFSDPRACELGRLLIGSEWPSVMSPGDYNAYLDELHHRMYDREAPWMSVPKALEEIRSLRPAMGDAAAILDEYESYLRCWSVYSTSFAAE